MVDEHSFDIVSRVDLSEVTNSVQQATKEMSQRFDFKGSRSSIEFNKDKAEITLISDDEQRMKSVIDILQSKLVKRGLSLKSLQYGKMEQASLGTAKQVITLQQGIAQDKAREIVKIIKDLKMKIQVEIQKDQVRVRAKKIDDLQTIISMFKEKDLGIYMEFINYR
ncbi:YajQ family cyclic di-GMP-binding protein [bacterium]|nr:YajQ family cyclic di-GMP-binding protein [bacterium]MBU2462297.1 YajQ family cyclic di-GMP-binding protein [bacterium]